MVKGWLEQGRGSREQGRTRWLSESGGSRETKGTIVQFCSRGFGLGRAYIPVVREEPPREGGFSLVLMGG